MILYLLLYIPSLLYAQNFDWFKTIGDTGNDFGQWVETDSVGNVYTAGFVQGTCHFNANTIANVDPFWFVSKNDSDGANIWITKIPVTPGYTFEMRDFKVSRKGEVYIVGDVNTNGSLYGLLVKVDSIGNLVKQFTPSQTSNVSSIAFASDGSYYIGGRSNAGMVINKYSEGDTLNWDVQFAGIDHATGSITVNATQGILDADRVRAKYDANGTLVWAKNQDNELEGRQIIIDYY